MSWNLSLRLQDLENSSLKNPLTTNLDGAGNNISNVGTLGVNQINATGSITSNATLGIEINNNGNPDIVMGDTSKTRQYGLNANVSGIGDFGLDIIGKNGAGTFESIINLRSAQTGNKELNMLNNDITNANEITANNRITTSDLVINEVMRNQTRVWTGNAIAPFLTWTEAHGNSVILGGGSQTGTDYVYYLPTDNAYNGMIFSASTAVSGLGNPALKIREAGSGTDIVVLGPVGSVNASGATFVKNGSWYLTGKAQ